MTVVDVEAGRTRHGVLAAHPQLPDQDIADLTTSGGCLTAPQTAFYPFTSIIE